ncbi:hypothetical protein Aduo_004842 [Ancylostoma duodenale]
MHTSCEGELDHFLQIRDSLPDSTTADSPRVIRGSGYLAGSASSASPSSSNGSSMSSSSLQGALMSTDFRVVPK